MCCLAITMSACRRIFKSFHHRLRKVIHMDAIECIHTRRSIRRYTGKEVSEDTVREILAAAMTAPSARNQQAWQFIVVTDKEILNKIPEAHPHARMAPDAALVILVCGDINLETSKDYWVQDCAAATQNILLASHALGLGAVWCGVYPREDRVDGLRKLLNLPHHIIPLSLIPIGHPDQPSGRVDRFKQDRIHHDGW